MWLDDEEYMQTLLNAAMKRLEELSVDASRLGGLRSRYERFGYEPCGTLYRIMITKRNAVDFAEAAKSFTFQQVEENDQESIAFIREVHDRFDMHAERGDDRRFYAIMRS